MSSANQNLLALLLVYTPYPGQFQNAIKQQTKFYSWKSPRFL